MDKARQQLRKIDKFIGKLGKLSRWNGARHSSKRQDFGPNFRDFHDQLQDQIHKVCLIDIADKLVQPKPVMDEAITDLVKQHQYIW